ncbi:MAG: hypothetical protein J6583_07120 [Gilliamella sp.]|nr:hypothetical protein [Gilliamella sp.]
MVSRPTIYNVLKKARLKLFVPLTSKNERYKTIRYGFKRQVKVEKSIEDKLTGSNFVTFMPILSI